LIDTKLGGKGVVGYGKGEKLFAMAPYIDLVLGMRINLFVF